MQENAPWLAYQRSGAAPPSVQTRPADPLQPLRQQQLMQQIQADQLRIARETRDAAREEGVDTPGNANLTGDAYLATLPRNMQQQVRALSEGRIAWPTGRAATDPHWQQVIAATGQFDPTFDAANYTTRVGTRRDFTSGVARRNITSLNTALGHMETLYRAADALDNGNWQIINGVRNAYRQHSGDPRVNNFNIARQAVTDELERAFRGAGGTQTGIEEWKSNINAAQSPEQLHAAIQQGVTLLDSRLQALGDQYNAGMGRSDEPISLLNEHARHVMQALGPGGSGLPPVGMAPGQGPPQIGGPPAPGAPPGGDLLDRGNRPMAPSGGDQVDLAAGPTHSVPDPTLAGVNARVDHMLRTHVPDEQIRAYLQGLPRAPGRSIDLIGVDEALAFRRAHPNYRGTYNPSLENIVLPVSAPRQIATNLADTGPGAYTLGAGNALTAGYLPEIAPGDTELNRAGMREVAARHAPADIAGNVAGGALATIVPEMAGARFAPAGVAALLAKAPRLSRAIGATGYGAAYGSGMSPDDRLGGALEGAALAPLAELGGAAVTTAAGHAIAPTGGALSPLYDAGVRPTIGQRLSRTNLGGRLVNSFEQLTQSVPGLGLLPARARQIARDQFERGAFNRALREVGDQLPDTMPLGTGPHEYMQNSISNVYREARSGMQAVPDAPWTQDFSHIHRQVGSLTEDSRNAFNNIMEDSIKRRSANSGGVLAGDDFIQAQSEIGRKIRALRSNPNGDRELASALEDLSGALDNSAMRNSPQASVDRLGQAHAAHAQAVRIENAGAARGGGESIGRFTPTQYDAAVQRASGGIRSRAYLRGDALGSDYAEAGRALVDTIPNSGSAERLMTGQGLVAGTGWLSGIAAEPTAMAGAALTALPYLPGLNKAIGAAMAPRESLRALQIGQLLRKYNALGGAAAVPLAVENAPINR